LSFSSKKVLSEELGAFFLLRRFWQNLGMSASDVRSLSHYDFEFLNESMSIEEQYQNKETEKQNRQILKRQ